VHVAIYLRISHDPFAMRAGVERQRSDCEAIARVRWPGVPTATYEDNDRSAYKATKRPAFDAMLSGFRNGQVQAIVAWNLDRLLRQPRQLEALIDLGAPIVTAQGDLDLTTHDGQLHARILAAVAKKASDDTSRRVSRALADKRDKGEWFGRTPFGYRQVKGALIVEPEEAALIRRAAQAIERGTPWSRLGPPLSHNGWRRVLTSPTTAGLTNAFRQGRWEPILTPTQLATFRAMVESNKRQRPIRRFWLHGIARCGICNSILVSHSKRQQGDYIGSYWCPGHVDIRAVIAETVAEHAIIESTRVNVRPETETPPVDNARLIEAATLYAQGALTLDEWQAIRQTLVAATPPRSTGVPVPEALAPLWSELDASGRALIARQLIDALYVDAGRGPSRIRIAWRE
jgi:DNA invertase Pin-like site-specific DNA recombinase